ncbi:MAG: AMP-dependent synthetase/ligase [Deltaproteobacteria bacterium]|nr:AMP-dependent synthetase/ligase [Deltaproteobacteria bacterium]
MDVTALLATLEPAPKVVFTQLATRADSPRFLLPQPDGTWSPVTWREFATQLEQMTAWLLARGLSPNERGAIFAPNRVEWLSAALAIEAARGVMVPIYPASTAEQLAYIVNHSDAKVLFVDTAALLVRCAQSVISLDSVKWIVTLDPALDRETVARMLASALAKGAVTQEQITALESRLVPLAQCLTEGAAALVQDPSRVSVSIDHIDLDAPAVMLYTSGTTGHPKGVPLTHRNVGINGRDWLECNGPMIDENAVDLLWLPFSHIFGFGEACLGNTLGFVTYMCDPASVLTRLPEVRPSVFMSVPAYWEKIAMKVAVERDPVRQREVFEEVTGGRMRFCLSGGAGLKREVKDLFFRNGIVIIEGYGLTECSPTLTLNRPTKFRFDSVGIPLPSVELKLADDGEILARGPSIFAGYHKDEEATRGAFTDDGWFKTGDVGRFTDDGFLQIIDRKKDILVTAGGKNIPPVNIEQRFADDPLFSHVVVFGDGQRYIAACVWLQQPAVSEILGDAARDTNAVRSLVQSRIDHANEQLAHHERIKQFAIVTEPLTVENGMLTASLKLRRKKIYEQFSREFASLYQS